ncbi:MAG: SDR family NAD(P)-dependent oxidoreductase [Chloroflexota bacterium]
MTGASRGIGEATALALGRAGVNVVLAARTDTEIEDPLRVWSLWVWSIGCN